MGTPERHLDWGLTVGLGEEGAAEATRAVGREPDAFQLDKDDGLCGLNWYFADREEAEAARGRLAAIGCRAEVYDHTSNMATPASRPGIARKAEVQDDTAVREA